MIGKFCLSVATRTAVYKQIRSCDALACAGKPSKTKKEQIDKDSKTNKQTNNKSSNSNNKNSSKNSNI